MSWFDNGLESLVPQRKAESGLNFGQLVRQRKEMESLHQGGDEEEISVLRQRFARAHPFS